MLAKIEIRKNLIIKIIYYTFLIFLFSGIPSLFLYKNYSRDHLIIMCLIGFMMMVVTLFAWRNVFSRIISITLVIAVTLNIGLSSLTEFNYNSSFDQSFALNFLITSRAEAVEMIKANIFIIPLFICVLFVLFYLVSKLSKDVPKKLSWVCTIVLIIYSSVYYITSLNKMDANEAFHLQFSGADNNSFALQRLFLRTPLYNVRHFLYAKQSLDIISKIKQMPPPAQPITVKETDIDTYVVVIGESARKKQMQLYGYDRETTPYLTKEKITFFYLKMQLHPRRIPLCRFLLP